MDLETLSSLEDISSENVERVVNAFYSEPSNELNMWLTNAQFSKEAWAFCWDLLAPEKSELIKFFGVNSLFNKLQYHWHEVPDSELINLREKLFYILNNQQCPTKHIQKKICMTISQYLRKSILTRKEGSVEYLHQLLRNDYGELSKSQESNIVNFLEILTVLPGDVCYMDNTDPLKSVLAQEAHVVLKLGQNILEHQNAHTDSVVAASLCCLQVWLPLIEHLASGHYDHLYSQIFGTLQRNSKEALECLLVFFQCPTNHLYPFKVFEYMNRVTDIVDLWKQTHEVKDHDFGEDLCRLVVYVAQLCIKLLITHVFTHPYITKTTTDLMHMVVGCMDIPGQFPVDECHSDLTFAFWYFLQDALTGENDKKEVEEFFIPFFKAAFRVMKKKIIHPLHGYHLWSAEEKERFRCYRQDNADTVAYYQKFLGEEIVKDLCGEFMALLDSGSPTWQEESCVSVLVLESQRNECHLWNADVLKNSLVRLLAFKTHISKEEYESYDKISLFIKEASINTLSSYFIGEKRKHTCGQESIFGFAKQSEIRGQLVEKLNSKENSLLSYSRHDDASMSPIDRIRSLENDGWIIIQHRVDDTEDFKKRWKEYKSGFGSKNKNFWLGLDQIENLTKHLQYKVKLVVVMRKPRKKRSISDEAPEKKISTKNYYFHVLNEFFHFGKGQMFCPSSTSPLLTTTSAKNYFSTSTQTTDVDADIDSDKKDPLFNYEVMIEEYNVFYIASEVFEYSLYINDSLRTQTTFMEHSRAKFSTFDRPNSKGFQLHDVGWWFIKNNAFIANSPYRSLHYYIQDKSSYEMVQEIVICIKRRT